MLCPMKFSREKGMVDLKCEKERCAWWVWIDAEGGEASQGKSRPGHCIIVDKGGNTK